MGNKLMVAGTVAFECLMIGVSVVTIAASVPRALNAASKSKFLKMLF